jgi:hypothetical protein
MFLSVLVIFLLISVGIATLLFRLALGPKDKPD